MRCSLEYLMYIIFIVFDNIYNFLLKRTFQSLNYSKVDGFKVLGYNKDKY